ncbi:MAG: hypothetical protein KBF88_16045 [Polyangiaceae bacterium]|nr:hypothetical protein [Polyangiaceae bacterium]
MSLVSLSAPAQFVRILGVSLVSALSLMACSSDPEQEPDTQARSTGDAGTTTKTTYSKVSKSVEQENDHCASRPKKLLGTVAAGGACTGYEDCAPVCCGCSDTNPSFSAAACADGICTAKTETCALAESDFICGRAEGGTSSGPTGGGSGGAGGTGGTGGGSSGGSASGANTTICTSGTASSCYGMDEKWTGSQCCVSNVSTCADGTASSCYGMGEYWTGAKCCVASATQCVDGTASSCYGDGELWTGSKCCVTKAKLCTSGTASSCYGIGKYWTGSLCCVE